MKAPKFTKLFQSLVEMPERATFELLSDSEAFERTALKEHPTRPSYAALFQAKALAFLLFDFDDNRLLSPAPPWVPNVTHFSELEACAIASSNDGRLKSFVFDESRLMHLLWTPTENALAWNIPQVIRDFIRANSVARVVIIAGGARDEGPLKNTASGFGLSDLEQRVLISTITTGSIRAAAESLNIAYGTARATLVQAARRLGQPNTPALVRTIVEASFGVFPDDAKSPTLFSEMLQITQRQAQLALLVVSGATRHEAASAMNISVPLVKKELELIYTNLQIESAAELSRIMVEVQALRAFARTTDGAPGFLDRAIEPARFAVRPSTNELIGWSDYGPASAKPILVVHSNWSCRAVPSELLVALQKRGWRPISIDRPGFGATSLGSSTPDNPFEQAVQDTLHVMDKLRIEKFAVIARAGSDFVRILKASAPQRVGAVVLVSPTLPTKVSRKRTGIMGTMKDVFQIDSLIELFFRIVCSQISLERVEMLTRAIVKGASVDEALCDNPQFIYDRFRAVRPFSTGNFLGGIYEQGVISRGDFAFPKIEVIDWVIMQGDDDNHNSLEDVKAHWSTILPQSTVINVKGGGRFLTSSHPQIIVDQLEAMTKRGTRKVNSARRIRRTHLEPQVDSRQVAPNQ
ncbi:MAG TPA: hypothetical protein DIU09_15965 [Hyphomonadaceae bacterium]|nr:hypothetical protein AEM38_11775 [Hyphomonadaceae bacterium UKL13-1]HCP66069.1 hypothetical protein [Hyphomonadaceae bacterium]